MALDYEIIKNRMTVFVQDSSVSTFDPSLAYACAIAQSYSLDLSGDTQEVIDMADCESEWASPEVNKKSWTLSVDSLLLRNIGGGNGTIDIFDKYNPYQLEIGDIVWCVIGDASCGSPYNPNSTGISYRYGKAVVTGINQSGNTDDFHTISATFNGKGALSKSV